MFQMVDPVCPKCGSKVPDKVSEFLFSGDELPTLDNTSARITGHKCGCGHRFVVVAYDSDEPWRASQSAVLGPLDHVAE
jgi:hypothetical protein